MVFPGIKLSNSGFGTLHDLSLASSPYGWRLPWNKLSYLQNYIKTSRSDGAKVIPYLQKLAKKLKLDLLEKPRFEFPFSKKTINPFGNLESLAKLKKTKERFARLMKLKNRKIENITKDISKTLVIPVPKTYQDIDLSMLPSLDSMKKHVNTVISRPEIIPSLAETITKYMMGEQEKSRANKDVSKEDETSKPTVRYHMS